MRLGYLMLAVGLAVGVPAAAFEQKPEDAVKMRQGFMQSQSYQLNWLKEVGKGAAPFDDLALERVSRLQQLSRILPDMFVTPSGPERVAATNALPKVWEDPATLAKRIERLQLQVDRLAVVAGQRDAKALDAQVKQVVDACKGCHNDFRKADKKPS